jgi:ubiquinone/menaquinone biosynthesis C-methylase UbiE
MVGYDEVKEFSMKNPKAEVWKSSALAQKYLEGVRGAVPLAKEQIETMMRLVAAREEPVLSFLDLGCGDGILAAAILGQYPEAKGVLLDFSEPMIKAAKERLNQYAHNLDFVMVDYGNPAWVNAVDHISPFDAVVSGFSIHHQTDERKRELYGEIYSLLKPGGIFINIEHVSSPTRWVEAIFENYFIDSLYARHLRSGSQKNREEVAKEFYHRPDKAANKLAPVELQCNWLRIIGFEDVDCYFKAFELTVFGGRRPRIGIRDSGSGIREKT